MITTSIAAMAEQFNMSPVLLISLFAVLIIWSLFWKGWALWVAARKAEKIWFAIFLLVNTVGILEIIYLFLYNTNDRNAGEPN